MSDWGATHHDSALMAGLDQEMPKPVFLSSEKVASELSAGNVTLAKVDDSVLRILTSMLAVGAMDRPATATGDAKTNVTSPAHNALARKLAAAGIIVLQNEAVAGQAAPLPLTATVKTLALFGAQAQSAIVGGGGSGAVGPAYVVSPMEAIRARLGFPAGPPTAPTTRNNCSQAHWLPGIDFVNTVDQTSGKATSTAECCAMCAARPGCLYFTFVHNQTCWMKGSNAGATKHGASVSGSCYATKPKPKPECHNGYCLSYTSPTATAQEVAAAVAAADVSLVFGATTSSEGEDRLDLTLSNGGHSPDKGQDELFAAVAVAAIAAGKPSVGVTVSPGALRTPWAANLSALVSAFMPGQEYGNALADILWGDVNPSGRLPITFPIGENDTGFSWPDEVGSQAIGRLLVVIVPAYEFRFERLRVMHGFILRDSL